MLTSGGKTKYVDGEALPELNQENFEMAHARKQRLERDFGDNAPSLFSQTFSWIENNEVTDYQKSKSEAKRNRKTGSGGTVS